MSRVAILMLPEPGHILPTMRLANILRGSGHLVSYYATKEKQSFFDKYKLPYRVMFSDGIPKDCTPGSGEGADMHPTQAALYVFARDSPKFVERLVAELRPLKFDLLLCDSVIMKYVGHQLLRELKKPILSISVSLPLTSQGEAPVSELVFCPREFELPNGGGWTAGRRPFYAEASVFRAREPVAFPWKDLDLKRHLVYCSFGTQYARYGRGLDVLRAVIRAFDQLPGCQAVIAAGDLISQVKTELIPKNVILTIVAPQLQLLACSRLFITHGGLGSVKESIINGVPMLVTPFHLDQPDNASRVTHHGIGTKLDPGECNAEAIRDVVIGMLSDEGLYEKTSRMRALFCKREEQAPAAEFVLTKI